MGQRSIFTAIALSVVGSQFYQGHKKGNSHWAYVNSGVMSTGVLAGMPQGQRSREIWQLSVNNESCRSKRLACLESVLSTKCNHKLDRCPELLYNSIAHHRVSPYGRPLTVPGPSVAWPHNTEHSDQQGDMGGKGQSQAQDSKKRSKITYIFLHLPTRCDAFFFFTQKRAFTQRLHSVWNHTWFESRTAPAELGRILMVYSQL